MMPGWWGGAERGKRRTDIEFFWVAALVHGTKDAGNVLTNYDIAGGEGIPADPS